MMNDRLKVWKILIKKLKKYIYFSFLVSWINYLARLVTLFMYLKIKMQVSSFKKKNILKFLTFWRSQKQAQEGLKSRNILNSTRNCISGLIYRPLR